MVRMVAITASLAMSSQVGCYRCAHEIGGKGKLKREQNPSREPDPDLPPLHLVGGFFEDRRTPVRACTAPKATTSTAPASMRSAI